VGRRTTDVGRHVRRRRLGRQRWRGFGGFGGGSFGGGGAGGKW
jgi:hypothetical protein